MARSLLGALVSGTRAVLAVQLFVGVTAVAIAGWTLGVTNELIRERDLLRERVIQLEETMVADGRTPPAPPAVVGQVEAADEYPPSIRNARALAAADANGEAPALAANETAVNDLSSVFGGLFTPLPPLRAVVLHVRAQTDEPVARSIAAELMSGGDVEVSIAVLPERDPRRSGYVYFDGRQNRAAADIVARFHDIARRTDVTAWAAQLRGTALPADGEYTASRLDIVLPPLPPPPAPPVSDPPVTVAAPPG